MCSQEIRYALQSGQFMHQMQHETSNEKARFVLIALPVATLASELSFVALIDPAYKFVDAHVASRRAASASSMHTRVQP